MPKDIILADPKDNITTALRQFESGDTIHVAMGDYTVSIELLQNIPFGHKFALQDIELGQPIIKYGEVIGLATRKIRKGEHVHIHNVEGLKGRGDRQ